MKPKEMYSTKAMDYYRKLLRSKAMMKKSPKYPEKTLYFIFPKQNKPGYWKKTKKIKDRRVRVPFDRDEDRDNIFSNTFFGDDLFNKDK